MASRRSCFVLLLFAILGCPTPSLAQPANTTCDKPDFLFLNERARYPIDASGKLYFQVPVVYGHSYAVQAWVPEIPAGVTSPTGSTSVRLRLFHSNGACNTDSDVLSQISSPGIDQPWITSGRHQGWQYLFIAGPQQNVTIELTNERAIAHAVNILMMETTLFSPWWFTGGTNQAFVEIGNTTNMALEPVVTFRDREGLECGSWSSLIPGFGNTAINVNSIGTCASKLSGSAQIAFPSTPGAFVANITTIDVVNGTSFDAPFTPKMVWGTFGR